MSNSIAPKMSKAQMKGSVSPAGPPDPTGPSFAANVIAPNPHTALPSVRSVGSTAISFGACIELPSYAGVGNGRGFGAWIRNQESGISLDGRHRIAVGSGQNILRPALDS